MIGQLFSNSNGAQKANLLNTLFSSGAAAGILSQVAQAAGISIPSASGGTGAVTPEVADRVPADAVQKAAAHAKEHDPSIVDRVSEIYAQHPMLVKSLARLRWRSRCRISRSVGANEIPQSIVGSATCVRLAASIGRWRLANSGLTKEVPLLFRDGQVETFHHEQHVFPDFALLGVALVPEQIGGVKVIISGVSR